MLLKHWVLSSKAPYSVIPDYLQVDFDNLPYEVDLAAGFLHYLWSVFLFLTGAMMTAMALLVTELDWYVFFVLLACGLLVFRYGAIQLYSSYKYSRRIMFLPKGIRFRFGSNKVITIPYTEFTAIASSTIMSQWGKHVYFHQICEFVHSEKRLNAPFCITHIKSNAEPQIQALARRCRLPIWRQVRKGFSIQQPEDLDRPLADKVFRGEIPIVPVLPSPPSDINVTSDSVDGEDVLRIRITKTQKAYFITGIALITASIAGYIGLFMWDVIIGVFVLMATLPFWILLFVIRFKKFEELEIASGIMTVHGNQNSIIEDDLHEWKVPLMDATELLLHSWRRGPGGLSLLCGDEAYRFGEGASVKSQEWLRDFIHHYIRDRYVPNQDQADRPSKISFAGANQ